MDLRKLKSLIDLVQNSGISELEISEGEERIRIAKYAPATAATNVTLPAATLAAQQAPGVAADSPAALAKPEEPEGHVVKAPMVGTAYIAPQPDQPPFVKLGDRVEEGRVLLIIEAMKVMNQIRAPRAGRVTQIFAEDGEPVEYGAALMLIE